MRLSIDRSFWQHKMFHLQNITFTANDENILSIDDLRVDEKEPSLIIGPSGCGKTTLLQIMAGIRKASSGSAVFNDNNLHELSGSELDRFRATNFGFIFQNFHLIKHISVFDNIRLANAGAKIKIDHNKIQSLLDQLNLSNIATRKASTLSQGEAQRVAIARAVINDPQVIFADEPTSALDDKNADSVIDLLVEQAKKTGAMLIVATHDNRITDRFKTVIEMDKGKILA